MFNLGIGKLEGEFLVNPKISVQRFSEVSDDLGMAILSVISGNP